MALSGGKGCADQIVVLHVRVLADRGGGPEKTILSGPTHFRDTSYRLVAAYMHPPGSDGFARLAEAADLVGCELVGVLDRGPVDPRPVLSLLRLCRRLGVAIWHAHDYKSNVLGLLLRRFHPMRVVTTLHGWADLDVRTSFYFALDRACLRNYDHVFAVSVDLAQSARENGVAERRVSMLRNGVDVTYFRRGAAPRRARLRRELEVPENRLVIGTVGRLVPAKGLDLVLDAWSRLSKTGFHLELWVVGEGPERGRLERLTARLGIARRTRFLGYYDDVRPVLEALDLFVTASLREGTPNALLEALAMEVPVVATDVGGVSEMIRDGQTGFLRSPGDAAAIAEAMRRLIADSDLRRSMARNGRRVVESEFSLVERMRLERAVYDRLLAEAPL